MSKLKRKTPPKQPQQSKKRRKGITFYAEYEPTKPKWTVKNFCGIAERTKKEATK
jgi:hypothetical protein